MVDSVFAAPRQESIVFEEDFRSGSFADGPGARWRLRPAGGLPAGDGITSLLDSGGVVVVPGARHPQTGEPAFTPESRSGASAGNHLRWAAFALSAAPASGSIFELGEGAAFTADLAIGAEFFNTDPIPRTETLGTAAHDLDAGMAAMICADFETGMIFDIALTRRHVFVLYERLPRPGSDRAAFSYAIPVADHIEGTTYRCTIAVDSATGTVRWFLDGNEVQAIERIGRRLPSDDYLIWSTGGSDDDVRPRGLALGFGMFAESIQGQGMRVTVRSARVRIGTRVRTMR
ncbi:DUF6081 family protein [Nocardia sp. NBC_01388]|uniref:DUF6081 family protein n=1 Tax=Nocardia sp. NBC_01388 TaxID=2903596 RepID=UPI00324372DD